MYKFAHDHIKESAAALVPDNDTRKRLHLHIGQQLYQLSVDGVFVGSENQVEDRFLLLAVHHLNLGSIDEKEQKVELARLNCRAAVAAFKMFSFFAATEFLERGLDMLDNATRWDEDYDLTLRLTTTLAHIGSYCGQSDATDKAVAEILEHATCLKDKLGGYRSLSVNLSQEGRDEEAMEINLTVLEQLGVRIPQTFLKLNILRLVLRVRRKLSHCTDEGLLALPEGMNESLLQAPPFISLSGGICASTGNAEYQALAVMQFIFVTLKCNNRDWTPLAYAMAGCLYSHSGDITTAHQYANLAYKAMDADSHPTLVSTRIVAATHFSIFHWRKPCHQCLEGMLKAVKMASEIGKMQNLFLATMGYFILYFHCKLQLGPLEKDMRQFGDMLQDYSQTYFFSIFQPQLQFFLNLMGQNADPTVLTGEVMDQEDYLRMLSKGRNDRGRHLFHRNRMFLAYIFDDIELAEDMASKLLSEGSTPGLAPRYLFEGLIAFRRRYRRKGWRDFSASWRSLFVSVMSTATI